MTAYPTAPPAAFGAPLRKPTDVMGRRIGAYFLNGLLGAVVIIGLFFAAYAIASPGKRYTNVQAQTGQSAQDFCDHYDPNDRNNKICIASGDNEIILLDGGPVVAMGIGAVVVWWIVNYMILEGLAGGSLGKLIVGLRVIRENGSKPGLGWALLRNLLLIIPDQILFGIVGLIVSLTNDDHQRVGDLAASTYVVDKHAAGMPLRQAPPGFAGYAAPGQGVYTQPTFGPPGQVQGQVVPSQVPAAEPAAVHQPQWDAARNTYIWWNAEQQAWLEHDRASGEWRPISQ